MAQMYFANDGNYGDATNLTIIDTATWQPTDYDAIDDVHDTDRAQAAALLAEFITTGRTRQDLADRLADLGCQPAVP